MPSSLRNVHWKREPEGAAFACLALGPNVAAVSLNNALGDVETEPNASSVVLVDLDVRLEDRSKLVVRNSAARVAHGKAHLLTGAADADDDEPVGRSELNCVRKQVDENLKYPRCVERDRRQWLRDLRDERQASRGGLQLKRVYGLPRHLPGVSNLARDGKYPGLDTSDVDEVADQTIHSTAGALATPSM